LLLRPWPQLPELAHRLCAINTFGFDLWKGRPKRLELWYLPDHHNDTLPRGYRRLASIPCIIRHPLQSSAAFLPSTSARSRKMVALIAVARKILTILNAMLRTKSNGNPFDKEHSR
jgi:hypothetical protein